MTVLGDDERMLEPACHTWDAAKGRLMPEKERPLLEQPCSCADAAGMDEEAVGPVKWPLGAAVLLVEDCTATLDASCVVLHSSRRQMIPSTDLGNPSLRHRRMSQDDRLFCTDSQSRC